VQFIIELMALRIGSKFTKIEKLTAITEPSIFLYTKTGTISFPKIYLDGIICENHFYQVQGQGQFNKHLSLIQSPGRQTLPRQLQNTVPTPSPGNPVKTILKEGSINENNHFFENISVPS
jgi:hypothetical protein